MLLAIQVTGGRFDTMSNKTTRDLIVRTCGLAVSDHWYSIDQWQALEDSKANPNSSCRSVVLIEELQAFGRIPREVIVTSEVTFRERAFARKIINAIRDDVFSAEQVRLLKSIKSEQLVAKRVAAVINSIRDLGRIPVGFKGPEGRLGYKLRYYLKHHCECFSSDQVQWLYDLCVNVNK